jgi:hypothetical protein
MSNCGLEIRVRTIRWAEKEMRDLLMERLHLSFRAASEIRRMFGKIGATQPCGVMSAAGITIPAVSIEGAFC